MAEMMNRVLSSLIQPGKYTGEIEDQVGSSVLSLLVISVLQIGLIFGQSQYTTEGISTLNLVVQVLGTLGIIVIITSIVFYVGTKALGQDGELAAILLIAILGVFPTLVPQLGHLLEVALAIDLPSTAAKLTAAIWSLYIWSAGLNALVGINKVAATFLAILATVPFLLQV